MCRTLCLRFLWSIDARALLMSHTTTWPLIEPPTTICSSAIEGGSRFHVLSTLQVATIINYGTRHAFGLQEAEIRDSWCCQIEEEDKGRLVRLSSGTPAVTAAILLWWQHQWRSRWHWSPSDFCTKIMARFVLLHSSNKEKNYFGVVL